MQLEQKLLQTAWVISAKDEKLEQLNKQKLYSQHTEQETENSQEQLSTRRSRHPLHTGQEVMQEPYDYNQFFAHREFRFPEPSSVYRNVPIPFIGHYRNRPKSQPKKGLQGLQEWKQEFHKESTERWTQGLRGFKAQLQLVKNV